MASTDARPLPLKNTAFRVTLPILDADGDLVTGATGLDSEVSIDGGTFADCTNEATEIATNSGMYFLDLTSAEMNGDTIAIIIKTTSSGAKTTPITLYPADDTDMRVNVVDYLGGAAPALVGGRFDSSVGAMAANVLTATAINADAITAAKVADGTIDAATFAAGAINAAAIATDAITAAKIAADAITAAKVADGTIDAATFAAGAINAAAIATDAITAAKIAADAIGASELGADAVTEIQSGLATAAAQATLQADTDDIQTRLPAALVGGRMDSSVGAMAAAVLTATAIAADAITAAKIAADAIGASELAADAITEIQAGLALASALTTAQTAITDIQSRIPAVLVSGRIDASVGAMATSVVTATAIAADAIGASELASDAIAEIAAGVRTELATELARVDVAISTRFAAGSYTAPDNATIATIAANVVTIAGYLDTEVAAILAAVDTEVGSILTAATDIQSRLPAALTSGRMSSSVEAMAADVLTASALSAGAVDEILDDTIGDGTLTLRQAVRVLLSGMAGILSGAATTTVTTRNLANTADVITATVDAAGNRSAVTVTP